MGFKTTLYRPISSTAFIIAVALTSCFSERSPKQPDENSGWISPTEPSILLENLKKAVTTLDQNNYRRCIATEKFRFSADPTILANNLGLFSLWDWDNEIQYTNNLNVAAAPYSKNNSLSFLNPRTQNYSIDSLEFTANYALALYHQDTSLPSVNFTGVMVLKMKRNRQNEWQISKWEDVKTPDQTCWTELRQHFFNR